MCCFNAIDSPIYTFDNNSYLMFNHQQYYMIDLYIALYLYQEKKFQKV